MKPPAAILTLAVSLLIVGAAAVGGCGFGPGKSSAGEANLRVTRVFGTEQLVDATLTNPTESDNVVRFLDANADIETSYGGNFVDSIDGYAGSTTGGGDEDWFFFVNGYYSDVGAGETAVLPGDRIWWDYRYWSAAYRVPAVVGSWPEPFLSGYQGKHYDTVVECLTASADCDQVVSALEGAGVKPRVENVSKPVEHPDELRVLVGPWDALRADKAASQIESGPGNSGVYGQLGRCGNAWQLEIDDSHGKVAQWVDASGLVAAVREGQDQPTWVVTGTDDGSVAGAADLLNADSLSNRYAVATADGNALPLPSAEVADPSALGECG
jgi:hypothetical protein